MSNKIVVLVVPVGFTLFSLLENQDPRSYCCVQHVWWGFALVMQVSQFKVQVQCPLYLIGSQGVSQFKASRCNQTQQSQAQVPKSSTLCTFQLRKSFQLQFFFSSLVHKQQPLPKIIQNSVVSHHDHEF
jgi:hypothetical protein